MSQLDTLQIIMASGLLIKISLATIGSFRGWKGWPWTMWLGIEIFSGFCIGFLESVNLLNPVVSVLAIAGVGIITLIGLIYMASHSRYRRLLSS